MTPKITLITPTCGRPDGLRLAERWMARQTRKWDEWIVADGAPDQALVATPTLGQRHLWSPQEPGYRNFLGNVSNGVDAARGDLIIFIEDDDFYSPVHLETLAAQLSQPDVLAAGDDLQRYYNLPLRLYRTFENVGASLCQTGIRRWAVETLHETITECREKQSYGLDTRFWKKVPKAAWSLDRTGTVVGVKGLPGQVGLGIGHRPSGAWTPDMDLSTLKSWVGDDVSAYGV